MKAFFSTEKFVLKTYILKRLLALVGLLLGITLLVFVLLQLAPGDFLTPIKAQRDIQPELIEKLEKEFGLHLPWYQQYFLWLKNIIFDFNFGYSWTYKVPVFELIAQRAMATFVLALCSLAFAWTLGIVLGILAAVYQDSWWDRLSALLAYAALSLPEFFLALLAIWFAAKTGWFPVGGRTSIDHDFLPPFLQAWDYMWHLILPTLVLGIGGVAGMMRLMRANFLDAIRAEYVTTARAKGLTERVVMFHHVFRNAINPMLTMLGFAIAGLLSGSLLVENVMNYPGLGRLIYEAFIREDQFVVLGSVMLGSALLVFGNLIADILLAWSDPRIRYESKS
ncbi:MAG: ABC transporter permease [Verrucomicrobiota bacterium]